MIVIINIRLYLASTALIPSAIDLSPERSLYIDYWEENKHSHTCMFNVHVYKA